TETIAPRTFAQLQATCTFSSQSVLFGSVPKLFLTESKFFSILVIEFLWILQVIGIVGIIQFIRQRR
ncbi:MAG: hypothetical protein VX598_00005, partial [Verrucomicrobiota bacterium]|nr:hypothetical protein [Verrucomicrobiota bacterium]